MIRIGEKKELKLKELKEFGCFLWMQKTVWKGAIPLFCSRHVWDSIPVFRKGKNKALASRQQLLFSLTFSLNVKSGNSCSFNKSILVDDVRVTLDPSFFAISSSLFCLANSFRCSSKYNVNCCPRVGMRTWIAFLCRNKMYASYSVTFPRKAD